MALLSNPNLPSTCSFLARFPWESLHLSVLQMYWWFRKRCSSIFVLLPNLPSGTSGLSLYRYFIAREPS